MATLIRYDADNDWPLGILWTDEAHFNLNDKENTKNCVHWADTNLHPVAPVPFIWRQSYCVVRLFRHSSSRLILLWGSDTNGLCNMLCNRLSLYTYAAKLCHTRIASVKCTKWHRLDARYCTFTYKEVCLLGLRTTFWWSHHVTQFSFSVASAIAWSYAYGFLVLGRVYICNPQTLSKLKDSIKREMVNIPHTMLRSALLSIISRMHCVIACNGTHVENVWSK